MVWSVRIVCPRSRCACPIPVLFAHFHQCDFPAPFPASVGEEGDVMANRARKVAMAVAMIGAVLAPRTGVAADITLLADPEAHVRPTTPAVAPLVAHPMRGPAPFSQIVPTIEDS